MLFPTANPNPPDVTRPTISPPSRTGSLPPPTARGASGTRHRAPGPRAGAGAGEQRLATQEVALVEADREAEPGLERRLIRRDVGRPGAVALLEPEGIDGAVAARREPVLSAGLPERVPERDAVLGRCVELPAQLADVRHAHGHQRHGPHRQ